MSEEIFGQHWLNIQDFNITYNIIACIKIILFVKYKKIVYKLNMKNTADMHLVNLKYNQTQFIKVYFFLVLSQLEVFCFV